jgi:cytochrome c oxidase assembly protein subunit 11
MSTGLKRKNAITAGIALAVVAAMVGFAFAAVPLYRYVCKAVGLGGTTEVATEAPRQVSDVSVTVRFDANIDPQLPWEFKPNQKSVTMKLGESKTVTFHARNLSDHVTTGAATFNVAPDKIGQYFNKLACFCFEDQTLRPGEQADMGVTFFVDPALMKDTTANEVREITLSYTFFRSKNGLPIETDAKADAPAATVQAGVQATPPTHTN